MNKMKFCFSAVFFAIGLSSIAGNSFADTGAAGGKQIPRAFIVSPLEGASVTSPVKVVFGLENMAVIPAGTPHDNGGHHHLIVDRDLPDLSMPIPMDSKQIIHFGKGQTETTIDLPPGKHTLQLLIGDFAHRPHSSPVHSQKITVIVQ